MAAGKISRMGNIKQLLPWKDSNFLLESIKKANQSSANSTHVVLGANAKLIIRKCNFKSVGKPTIIINPNWAEGLGNSIAFGMASILESKDKPDAVLIYLADQPLVTVAFLNTLLETFKKSNQKIIASKYRSRAGVPALFDKSVYDKLIALDGDFGAKHVLENMKNETLVLEDNEVIIDIDTNEEYERLQKEFKTNDHIH